VAELIQRHLAQLGQQALDAFPVIVIEGARQVGKSTLAGMLVAGRPSRLVNLDVAAQAAAARSDPDGFVAEATTTMVIDEVQRAPGLLLAIKAAVDADRRPGRFILTGSSDLLALKATRESLAGRAVTLRLKGFSQGETRGRRDDFATVARRSPSFTGLGADLTRSDYLNVLATGAFPEMRHLDDRLRRLWLSSYLERILSRDAADVAPTLSADRLRAVLRLIAANHGGEFVTSRLASDLEITSQAVTQCVNALKTMYLVHDLPPWAPNLTTRQVGRHKLAVADSALALHLSGLPVKGLADPVQADQLGKLLEAFVVTELARQRDWSDEDFNLFHFRDRNGAEVDLVIEYGDGSVFLIEVKASMTYHPRHFSAMRYLAQRLGDRFVGGAVLGLAPQALSFGNKLWGLPVAALWEAGA
jgi:predicted AAA+ superfamily ATPase